MEVSFIDLEKNLKLYNLFIKMRFKDKIDSYSITDNHLEMYNFEESIRLIILHSTDL